MPGPDTEPVNLTLNFKKLDKKWPGQRRYSTSTSTQRLEERVRRLEKLFETLCEAPNYDNWSIRTNIQKINTEFQERLLQNSREALYDRINSNLKRPGSLFIPNNGTEEAQDMLRSYLRSLGCMHRLHDRNAFIPDWRQIMGILNFNPRQQCYYCRGKFSSKSELFRHLSYYNVAEPHSSDADQLDRPPSLQDILAKTQECHNCAVNTSLEGLPVNGSTRREGVRVRVDYSLPRPNPELYLPYLIQSEEVRN